MSEMNFDEAVAYLLSLGHETLAMKLGLTKIERLLSALGNPQQESPAIQIAGTNGKGSTAVVVDSICRSANIHTGLYTSPHLVSITERIKINGRQIERSDFARLASRVRQTAHELVATGQLETLPTFFEHVTAIALLAFREAGVQIAILETGLGGRLDATTAAGARIAALTPIALDHQEYLGDTLAEIAAEKAALIRPHTTVIVGPQLPTALAVILQHCAAANVTPKLVDTTGVEVLGAEDGRLRANFTTGGDSYENVRLGLRGRHQITNVAVAVAVAESLRGQGFTVPREAIVEGVENAEHPGRLEIHEGSPRILLDGAHNPAAAHALRDYLDEFVKAPVTLLFAAMRDKNLSEMLAILAPVAETVLLTTFANERAASLEMLSREMPADFPGHRLRLATSAAEALRDAYAQTPAKGLVCVTGSLYLVGEIKGLIKDRQANVA